MVKRGEVWRVDFNKLQGTAIRKKRPALVVQNDLGNKYGPTVIVAAIQNDSHKNLPIFVKVSNGVAGLTKDSIVNCSIVSAIPKVLLDKKMGDLPGGLMRDVEKALKVSLGLR